MLTIRNFLSLQVRAEKKSLWLVLCLIICDCISNTSKASAQIMTDETLPTNSRAIQNTNGDLITITDGTNAGNNLFHSFQEFSVTNGQTAFFNNGLNIENIFSRITGNSVSNIDGLIRANGTANLFLINPNGIIFGENASLDLGGSFLGSTADSIQFSDGSFYSAVAPQAPPLLEVNIPIGLQYGAEPGNIIVEGNGNNTGFRDPSVNDYSLVKDFRPSGLQVDEGNSLALIGGNIALDGGNLTAAEGHIELGSVSKGSVKLGGDDGVWTFDYQDAAGFQDIALANAASVEVSGNSSGTVNVQGQNLTLTDASVILSNTSGDGTAGSITLNGTESVQVTGVSQNEIPFVSYVSTGTAPGSTGKGADLNINTDYLLVAGGAQVDTPVFANGDGGTLTVNAEEVELSSGSPVAGASGLFAPVVPDATGEGGDINVDADSLLVAGGAQILALSVSSATGGDININAQNIELNGASSNGIASGLFTNTFANGDAGNLTIDADTLVVKDGGDIGSSVLGSGTAGNINITANAIELSDLSDRGRTSQISASVTEGATGIGGDINIEADRLTLNDGTQINASVFGSGNGGNVIITASEINLNGYSAIVDQSSGLFATVIPGATGDSGNMTITTDNLTVSEGAQIAVATGGSGSAGKLTITASNSVELTGNAIEAGGGSSGLFSSAVLSDGSGGDIDLTTNQLTVQDGATISASNFISGNQDVPPGTGIAGSIKIDAESIKLDGMDASIPTSITAATFDGGGGNITLDSKTITAKNGAQVTAETSGTGKGGSIIISADEFNLNNQAQVSVNSTGQGQAGNIAIASDNLTLDESKITATSNLTGGGDIDLKAEFTSLDNNSLISTSVFDSNGGGGNIMIDSDYVIANHNSDLEADAVEGPGGNINITTNAIFFSPDSEATASSEYGVDGVVEIKSPDSDKQIGVVSLKSDIVDPTKMISALCSTESTDTIIVSGKGGLGENPTQPLRGHSVWEDLRDFSLASHDNKAIAPTASSGENHKAETITEAHNWVVNAQGNVELISHLPPSFNQCKK